MSDDPLTYDKLMAAIKEIDAIMAGVPVRFVGNPITVEDFLALAYSAGVLDFEVGGVLPFTGIPFDRDPDMRRGYIEGRDNRNEIVKVFALAQGRIYEITNLDMYRVIVRSDRSAMARLLSPVPHGVRP